MKVVFCPVWQDNEKPDSTQLCVINATSIMKIDRGGCPDLSLYNQCGNKPENGGVAYVQYVTWQMYIHCTPCR